MSSAFGGLQSLQAQFFKHHYAPHSHPFYAIGVIEYGVQQFRYRGARLETPQGAFFVVHPDESHTGESAQPSEFKYRVFYPTPELMRLASDETAWKNTDLPFIQNAVIHDTKLSASLVELLEDLSTPLVNLELETKVLNWLTQLIQTHGGAVKLALAGQEPRAVREAREFLDAHFAENISLLELSTLVGLSPHHFARVFQRTTGFAPHAYLENQRIARAKQLLGTNMPIHEVGFLVGFAHQSHFTNRFRLHVGVPPGQFHLAARSRKT